MMLKMHMQILQMIKTEKVSNFENDKPLNGDTSVDNKVKVSETKNKEKVIKPSKILKSANVKSKDVSEEKETVKDKKDDKKIRNNFNII